jgi:hypothetical protein
MSNQISRSQRGHSLSQLSPRTHVSVLRLRELEGLTKECRLLYPISNKFATGGRQLEESTHTVSLMSHQFIRRSPGRVWSKPGPHAHS